MSWKTNLHSFERRFEKPALFLAVPVKGFLSREWRVGHHFQLAEFRQGMDRPVGLDGVVGKGLSGAIDPPGAKESVVKKEPSGALRPDVGHDSYDSHLFGGGIPVFRIPGKPVRHQSLRLWRRATASQCLQSMSRPFVILTASKPWTSNGRGDWRAGSPFWTALASWEDMSWNYFQIKIAKGF